MVLNKKRMEENNMINDWLNKHGDPEINRQVEKEAAILRTLNDLPSKSDRREMTKEEWRGWFDDLYEEAYDKGYATGYKAAKQEKPPL